MIWVILGLCIFNTLLIGVLGFKLDSIYNTVTHINNRGYDIQTDLNQLRDENGVPYKTVDATEEGYNQIVLDIINLIKNPQA